MESEDLKNEDRFRALAQVARLEEDAGKRILLLSLEVGFRHCG
jgi:hypothetical protein